MKMDRGQGDMSHLQSEIGQYSAEGKRHHDNGSLSKAVSDYEKAYHKSRELNDDKIERTCAFNLGAAHIADGDPKKGLELLHKAKPPDGQYDGSSNGDLYFNLGIGYEKVPDLKKAEEYFEMAFKEYFEYEHREVDLQIQCLDKCLAIWQKKPDPKRCAEVCQKMAGVYEGRDHTLQKAEKLSDKASHLRQVHDEDFEGEKKAYDTAEEALNVINDSNPQGPDCILAGKTLNDLGLLMTQLQKYDDALRCFEKAVEFVRAGQVENQQLEAVVLQNLGAAYNFSHDYQRAIKFHEDAADLYAKINYRNGQGQCFTNLAFAHSQLGNMKDAEIAFQHALLAAKNTNDNHMRWQALEGLGAVSYNMGEVNNAETYFLEALKYVGDNNEPQQRIAQKLRYAMRYEVSQSGTYGGDFMSTHGQERANLSRTPRQESGVNLEGIERQIIPHSQVPQQAVPMAGEQPAMSSIQPQSPPSRHQSRVTWEASKAEPPRRRRVIPLRKKDSIGPHLPKVSRGLGSMMSTMSDNSPRFRQTMNTRQSLIEESSSDDSSEGDSTKESSSDDSDDDDDDDDQNVGESYSSQKIDEIFAKRSPTSEARQSRINEQSVDELDRYKQSIMEKEQDEEEEEESSESSTSEQSTETDGRDSDTQVKSAPTLPTQSPPRTITGVHNDTYLQLHEKHTVNTVAQVHQSHNSFNRKPDSPRAVSSNESGGEQQDEDDEPPYATIGTIARTQQQTQSEGNDIISAQRSKRRSSSKSDGRKGENFFDSDESGSNQDENEAGCHDDKKVKNEDTEHGEGVEPGESSGMDIDKLPRGQREMYLHQQHQQLQKQDPPDLPPRHEEKSKTCVVM